MLTEHPKLRDDLIVSRQDTPAGAMFVVKDPATRRFFRLREAEYGIARRLDGATALETLQAQLQRETETEVPLETLQQFAEQLRRLGLLETGEAPALDRRPLRQRVAGSPLYVRLKALDPDRLFNRLVGKVWFFFTPGFIVVSLAAFVTALGITVGYWDEIVRDLARLYRFDALLLAWVMVLLVTTAHEFAHGLTCKRFGGEVHEIGFLLLYFQPAFYCNISDAWLFPEKSRRLWVTFAGAYFEMFVWSLATLAWWVTEPDTWVSFLALIVMATSGIKTIFNLNPLIKLDGYYLLSDYLELPNLRQRSMAYVKGALGRLRGSGGAGGAVSRRERRIYVTYGVLAATYSFWLLSFVALRFGSFMVEEYQAPGFLLFSGLLMTVFRNPLSKLARHLPAPLRRSPRELLRGQRRGVRVALAVVGVAALGLVQLELKIAGPFTVLPVRNADVRAAVDGIIEQVAVHEGARVQAGDLLVRLSAREYRAALDKVDAELTQARATLKMLRAGARPEEIGLTRDELSTAQTIHEHARKRLDEADRMRATRLTKAQATVKAAEERVQFARTDQGRLTELFAQGLISRKQLDDGQQELALRAKELDVAQAELETISADSLAGVRQDLAVTQQQIQAAGGRLKLLLAGSRPETIEATEAAVARLETERRYLADQVQRTAVVSPVAGIVTTPKLEHRLGEHVKQGDLILKVYELETITPEVVIPEKEIADVRPGHPVVLKARAYPGLNFAGRVKAVAPAAMVEEGGLGRKVFRVTIQMDEASELLKPEMTGHAKILCGRRPIGYLLTRRLARYLRVEFWSWW